MADIDIFSIQPSVISRDLSGKSFFIYGAKKSGKTSNAVKFPKPLLLAFEKGYNLLSGVKAQPINKWTEALKVKKQLLKDAEAVEKGEKDSTFYSTVICDTADLAYDQCEKYILDKEGVDYLDETENKRGYKAVSREYDNFFQEIVKAGYTLVVISHSEIVQVKENGEKYDKIQPTVSKRGLQVLSRLVDVMAYSTFEPNDSGTQDMVLYLRGSKELEAGSRNKYMSTKIPFTYQALLEDMQQAIDKLETEDGAVVTDTPTEVYQDQTDKLDFKEVKEEIKTLAKKFNKAGMMDEYKSVVEKHLGKGKLIVDTNESQVDILGLVLDDLKDIEDKADKILAELEK